MSVYINGMTIPPEGEYHMTLYVCSDRSAYIDVASFPVDEDRFEAVPVPDHGRLIDANALWEVAYKAWGTEYDPWVCNLFMEMINNAPTIIPADKEEE